MSQAFGQLNPLSGSYYQNPYILNPAAAGTTSGWEINGAFKKQWSSIPRTPSISSFTATYGSERKRSGFGLQVFSDKAGVVQITGIKLTYAYHLPVGSDAQLDFGLSGSITDQSINTSEVRGDITEETIYNFNQNPTYVDLDFGMAYRSEKLTIQGAIPDMKSFFNRDYRKNVADAAIYMTSISYRLKDVGSISLLEPKFVYRSVQNYGDIFDVGVNAEFSEGKLVGNVIYHSTNSVSFGLGTNYRKKLNIMAFYTTNTSDFQGYTNGEVEISARFRF